MLDHRTSIQTALQAFQTRPLREAALDLLGTLGYRSDKILLKKPSDSEKTLFEILVPLVQQAKRDKLQAEAAFLEDQIDACVLESYFPEEANAKNLLFIDQTLSLLSGKHDDIESFMQIVNTPTHPIRNQLLRLAAESPELFGVIKQEGEV